MKVFQINTTCNGSTGKIARAISSVLAKSGHECFFAYGISHCDDKNTMKLSSWFEAHLHDQLSKITGKQGYFSVYKTFKLVNKMKEEDPDIIHIHNLHGNYLCLPVLFRYLKKSRAKVVITMHDCWLFTGRCAYFTFVKCDKWKTGCGDCPLWGVYPISYFLDRTKKCYKDKQKWLLGISDRLTLITPSEWLAGLVKQSFLKDCPVFVINNGIDLELFKPEPGSFRKDHSIADDQHIILGVALIWERRKGLDVFEWLAENLPDGYQIVLVGTSDEDDRHLPDHIISIHRTNNQKELAEIYAAADVFVNPTREDNFPTTNIEAIACGTPVITFDTGGSPEIIDESCGCVVDVDDLAALKDAVINTCENRPFSKEACLARSKKYDMNDRYNDYLKLYSEL